jgi:hypothetical protein
MLRMALVAFSYRDSLQGPEREKVTTALLDRLAPIRPTSPPSEKLSHAETAVARLVTRSSAHRATLDDLRSSHKSLVLLQFNGLELSGRVF